MRIRKLSGVLVLGVVVLVVALASGLDHATPALGKPGAPAPTSTSYDPGGPGDPGMPTSNPVAQPQPQPPQAAAGAPQPPPQAIAIPPQGQPVSDCGPGSGQPSLQSLIDSAPAGSVLELPPCIYHETVVVAKPLTLDGQGSAQIRGSDVWSNWNASANGTYVSSLSVPTFDSQHQGQCSNGSQTCNWPEQVFSDGTPLQELAPGSTPGPGQFALDSQRHVVLGSNPAGHVEEVTTREKWIDTQSDDVTITGMTFWHAANAAETGAIGNENHNAWTLANSRLYYAHGGIVSLGGAQNPSGEQTRVTGNQIGGSGYEGINGYANANTLISGNVIYNNNLDGFDWQTWAGAGIKLASFTGLTISGNEVRDNHGPGIWCDINCSNVTISGNRISGNDGAGIKFEISSGATIAQNALWSNGGNGGGDATKAEPGISISSSNGADVSGNALAWNTQGIAVYSENRADLPSSGTGGNHVHDNVVLNNTNSGLSLAWYARGSGAPNVTGGSNTGQTNAFWYPSDENGSMRFRWQTGLASLGALEGTPGGGGSRYLSPAERDAVLSGWNLPSAPAAN